MSIFSPFGISTEAPPTGPSRPLTICIWAYDWLWEYNHWQLLQRSLLPEPIICPYTNFTMQKRSSQLFCFSLFLHLQFWPAFLHKRRWENCMKGSNLKPFEGILQGNFTALRSTYQTMIHRRDLVRYCSCVKFGPLHAASHWYLVSMTYCLYYVPLPWKKHAES